MNTIRQQMKEDFVLRAILQLLGRPIFDLDL